MPLPSAVRLVVLVISLVETARRPLEVFPLKTFVPSARWRPSVAVVQAGAVCAVGVGGDVVQGDGAVRVDDQAVATVAIEGACGYSDVPVIGSGGMVRQERPMAGRVVAGDVIQVDRPNIPLAEVPKWLP